MKTSFCSLSLPPRDVLRAGLFKMRYRRRRGGDLLAPAAALTSPAAVASLRQSYATLAVADHDYKGHRVKAMKAIEAACKLLARTSAATAR